MREPLYGIELLEKARENYCLKASLLLTIGRVLSLFGTVGSIDAHFSSRRELLEKRVEKLDHMIMVQRGLEESTKTL